MAGQQHDGDVDALPVQFDQRVDAGNVRPVAMEDDDVGIAGRHQVRRSSETTLNLRTAKPCEDSTSVRNPRSIGSSSMRRTRIGVRLADGGEKRGRRCLQGHDILLKSGTHLKSLPLGSVLESKTGRESTPRLEADRAREVQLPPCWRTIHAQSAQPTEACFTHVTRLALDACRAAPLRSRIKSAFPWRGN